MREWKESVERFFFTDHLDEYLKEFIVSQKTFSNDQESWEFLHATARVWKQSYVTDFDSMMIPSFFNIGNINAFLIKFSFPGTCQYTSKETLYWLILTGWLMSRDDGEITEYVCPCLDLNWRLQDFQYPSERCVWLNKRQFLEEMKSIYSRSQEVFLYHQEHPNDNNSPWVCGMESDCSRFLNHYAFCKKQLKNPEIVRLNTFEADQYVWYLIREKSSLYLLQLSDFG